MEKRANNFISERNRKRAGFTLGELLIVVAIIGILVGIAIPVFMSQKKKAQNAVTMSNLRSAYSELIVAAITGEGNDLPHDQAGACWIAESGLIYVTVDFRSTVYDSFSQQYSDAVISLFHCQDLSQFSIRNTSAFNNLGTYTLAFAYDESAGKVTMQGGPQQAGQELPENTGPADDTPVIVHPDDPDPVTPDPADDTPDPDKAGQPGYDDEGRWIDDCNPKGTDYSLPHNFWDADGDGFCDGCGAEEDDDDLHG